MNLQSVSQILDPFLLESMLCKNNYQIRHFFDPITKKNITKKDLEILKKFFSPPKYVHISIKRNFETFTYLDMLIFCFFVNKIFMLNEIVYLVRFLE